ncbi:MAG: RidA family protein [Deltaproteobacteria bacterium]|nr:RidA family protein [Deltaproteobacteria bacterium]
MVKKIHTNRAPEAIGPYSQAVAAHSFVFCSGQLGMQPESGSLAEGIDNQTRQALANMKAVLEAAGSSVERVVKTTIFLKNIENFSAVNTVYGEFFGSHRPARSTVEVSNLPRGALVEIECTAAL